MITGLQPVENDSVAPGLWLKKIIV